MTSTTFNGLTTAHKLRRVLAILIEWWKPILAAAVLVLAVLVIVPGNALDRQMSDRLLRSQALDADPSVLIVEISDSDIRKYGGPMVGRDVLTQALNRLGDAGAQRVMFDIFLGVSLDPVVDARLSAALARFGPARIGLVTGSTTGEQPHPIFARHATLLDGRLTPDIDGFHRQIGRDDAARGMNPALWLASGKQAAATVPLDIRIATRGFERRTLEQLIASRDSLAGRTVVFSASRKVAPTRAVLPLSIEGDRAGVLALGTQSVKQGYPAQRARGHSASDWLQLAAIALGFACALAARSGRQLLITGLAAAVGLFAANIYIGRTFAVEVSPVQMLTMFAVMINVTLIQRLRIVPMMSSFLRGDLSPEEIWAWRSHEQASNPALLLSFSGGIKRYNAAAAELVGQHGRYLARNCLDRRGTDDTRVELFGSDGVSRSYLIEWPSEQTGIAILRDVTEAESEQRALRRQLYTDDLTGEANRRGFDHALKDAAASGAPYAIYFLDMNGFKAVNDTHGHDAGDELLVQSAARLATTVRPSDVVARLGGDEFAVVVKGDVDPAKAAELAARMSDAISQPFALSSVSGTVRVGIAVGYARSLDTGNDPAETLRQADKSMYRDKMREKLKAAA